MTWLLPLFRHRATWGVGIVLGMLLAICAHGRLQFREGYRQGVTTERSANDSVQRIADAAEARARAETDATIAALRTQIQHATIELARLREARALAVGQYHEALRQYQTAKAALSLGDSLPAILPVCDALAAACANAVRAAQLETDSLTAQLQAVEALSATKDTIIATEPARISRSVRDAVQQERRTQKKPSRVGWFSAGALAGVLLEVLR